MKRRSYNQAEAEYRARILAARPELAALYADDPLLREPQDANEEYARAECLDAQQCVKGRGED